MDLQDYCNIILLIVFAWCMPSAQTSETRCINPEFDALVDKYISYSVPVINVSDAYESKNNVVFLDARELEEYNTSHIEDAIYIGYKEFDIDKLNSTIPKNSIIIVYCSIGYRSEKIGKKLLKNGFNNVYNLYGSIFEWVNQHYPIVDGKGEPTFNLHTYNKKWSKWVGNEDINKTWD